MRRTIRVPAQGNEHLSNRAIIRDGIIRGFDRAKDEAAIRRSVKTPRSAMPSRSAI